jgi:hypothetical protein
MGGISFGDWLSESADRIRQKRTRGLLQSAYYAYAGAALAAETRFSIGTNIYKRDWDLLIVLDTCRVDALRAVADEFDFLPEVDSIWSVGSTSIEWMALTFREQHAADISRTAYVNSNTYFGKVFDERLNLPHIAAVPFGPPMSAYNVVSPDTFAYVDNIYEYAWEDDLGTVLPGAVTDRAVAAGRQQDADRYVVHYMQPHTPYIGVDDRPEDVFEALKQGEYAYEEIWQMYLETLRLGLNEVKVLLDNFDAEKVVITADHGEAFGEWGFHSHNIACPHPSVRRVPWVETTAKDKETFEPTLESPQRKHRIQADVEEQLVQLGYR